MKQLYAKGFVRQTISNLLDFIKAYVNFAKPETAIKFDKEIDLITNNTTTMGIREQILEMKKQEGRQETFLEQKTLFVENLLRSSDFTDEKIASLAGVSQDFVQQIRGKLNL